MANEFTFTEDHYEQVLIDLFQNELGYNYECGYDVERNTHEPFYREVFVDSLRRLNPTLPAGVLDQALKTITQPVIGGLIQSNETFMDMLQGHVEVPYVANGEQKTASVKLVDYDNIKNNDFRIVNQWTVEELAKKRADIVVMLNGLPLVVVELKSAMAENADIHDAYLQIRNYQQVLPELFAYNAFNVISDMTTTKVGTITANEERYMEWKHPQEDVDTTVVDYETPFKEIFRKDQFLDILKNFICFDRNEGHSAKILSAYHQYYAVKKAMVRASKAVLSDGKIGVVWHTQGSGKSFTMVFFAHMLIQQMPEVTIVVVTDRKDLDNQLFGQFARCANFLRQTPRQAESREDLGEMLRGRKAGGVFFTTIQKFMDGDTALSDRRNIIVLTDEAHRSQYGDEKLTTHLNEDNELEVEIKKGFSKKMREALPNASFIGFTGTPISDRDRDTQEVFGNYIDIYDMSQAVDDGATRPVYYESRVMNLDLNQDILELLDKEFDALAEEGATDEQLDKTKHDLSRLEGILGDDKTIESLVKDIISHYEDNRQYELTGKAMIVALTRGIAIKIYKKILEYRPEWTEKVKVVMSSSNKDPESWQQIIGNEKYKQELARKFKDNDDEMKIAIVRDMWLTGFDVPSLATMYVYKSMSGHNLMQAIARVNRVFPGKEGGLIVDYIGIAKELRAAMKQYTTRDRNRFGDPDIAKTALLKWQEEVEICRDLMHGFDYKGFFSDDKVLQAKAISFGVNFLVAPHNDVKRKDMIEHANTLHRATTLCRSLLTPEQKKEECYFDAVRVMLLRLAQKGKISGKEINERISQLLTQSIKSEGVINLFDGKKREFSLFDEAFMEDIRRMQEKNLAVELLQKLLKERINQAKKVNVVTSEKFSDLLSLALSNYMKGMLTNEEVIEELIKMAEQLKQSEQEGDDLGLSEEEKAFYDALSLPEGVRQAYSDETFIQMTKELTEALRKNRTIDWNHKASARAGMRVLVKRLLRKYKYPPENAPQAIEYVMRQCNQWAENEDNLQGQILIVNGDVNVEHLHGDIVKGGTYIHNVNNFSNNNKN